MKSGNDTTRSIEVETEEESIELGREIYELGPELMGLVIGGLKSKWAQRGIEIVLEGKKMIVEGEEDDDISDAQLAYEKLVNSFQVEAITLITESLKETQELIERYTLKQGLVEELSEQAGYALPESDTPSVADILMELVDTFKDCTCSSCKPQNADEN